MNALQLGYYIRDMRKEKKLSIRKLELLSGVSNAYLSQIENGKRGIPSPDILRKIADPLGIPYEELLEKAGYLDSQPKEIVEKDLEDLFHDSSLTFKGRKLNEHQKKSMLSFIQTLIDMSEED